MVRSGLTRTCCQFWSHLARSPASRRTRKALCAAHAPFACWLSGNKAPKTTRTVAFSANAKVPPIGGGNKGQREDAGLPSPSQKPKKKGGRKRLDELCRESYPQHSRNLLQSWIMQGKVTVDGRVITKSGYLVSNSSKVLISASEPKYVCRAGHKMEAALECFQIEVANKVALDAGLSTGGFTDCLLQNGAAKVYGVDVGYGQVAERVRVDERVVVMERTNLRYLTASDLPEKVQVATLDLSFISILKVMDAVCQVLDLEGDLITLIKPQFEADRDEISRGGLVRSEETHKKVTRIITDGVVSHGFEFKQLMESPITGAQSGNKEFLAHFVYKGGKEKQKEEEKE